MVPLQSLVQISTVLGPASIARYNQFPSVSINGQPSEGHSSGEALDAIAAVAGKALPAGYTFTWSGISLQEQASAGQTPRVFALALLFSYLFLVAQYGPRTSAKAFSSEVGTGSREENASKQEPGAPALIPSKPERL
jgi:multidrug efflux pump subunit AcrB